MECIYLPSTLVGNDDKMIRDFKIRGRCVSKLDVKFLNVFERMIMNECNIDGTRNSIGFPYPNWKQKFLFSEN